MDNNAMMYRARYHHVDKYDLQTGNLKHPRVIYAVLNIRSRGDVFDKAKHRVMVKGVEAPTDYDQWLLVGKRDAIASRFPDRKPWVESELFSFLLLQNDEELALAKVAFDFLNEEFGWGRDFPDRWFYQEEVVRQVPAGEFY